jgi:hypothetical protein
VPFDLPGSLASARATADRAEHLDRHYEQLHLDMQLVFHDLGIAA